MPLSKLRRPITTATLAGIFLVTVTTLFYRSQSIPRGQPAAILYVANRTVDLGVLSPGDVREVAFRIANKGNRRVVINEIDRGCECGEPVRRTIVIPPGAAEDWVLNIDTKFKIGAFEKLTSFTTSDPAQPRFDLLVKGSVQPVEKSDDSDADQQQQVSVLIRRPQ